MPDKDGNVKGISVPALPWLHKCRCGKLLKDCRCAAVFEECCADDCGCKRD